MQYAVWNCGFVFGFTDYTASLSLQNRKLCILGKSFQSHTDFFGGKVCLRGSCSCAGFNGLIVSISTKLKKDSNIKLLMEISLVINCFAVMILGLGREAYAVTVAFLLLVVKVIIAFRYMQNKK